MDGTCKAATFLPNLDYIKKKKGKNGIDEVLLELKNRGYDYDFRKMRKLADVPLDARKEFMFVLRDMYNWDEDRFYDMGMNAVKMSFIMKNFIGLFINIRKLFIMASRMWESHYSVGKLENDAYEEGNAKLVLSDFDVDPLMCSYLCGYFSGVGKLTPAKDVKTVETKCTFRGDDVHEFNITWK